MMNRGVGSPQLKKNDKSIQASDEVHQEDIQCLIEQLKRLYLENDKLKVENDNLKVENQQLKEENAQLHVEREQVVEENKHWKEETKHWKEENKRLKEENLKLREINKLLQNEKLKREVHQTKSSLTSVFPTMSEICSEFCEFNQQHLTNFIVNYYPEGSLPSHIFSIIPWANFIFSIDFNTSRRILQVNFPKEQTIFEWMKQQYTLLARMEGKDSLLHSWTTNIKEGEKQEFIKLVKKAYELIWKVELSPLEFGHNFKREDYPYAYESLVGEEGDKLRVVCPPLLEKENIVKRGYFC